MIKKITITNYLSESIILDLRNPEQSGFFIRGVDGLGPVKATINTSQALSIDGSEYNSARLGERNVVFNLGFLENPTIEDVRHRSYRYFPLKSKVNIEVETDNRTTKTSGYVESNEPIIFSSGEATMISVICPDPYFRSVETIIVHFSSTQSLFSFPFSNESLTLKLIIFGNLQIEPQQLVTYLGDAITGVTMRIHALGAVGSFSVYNLETGQSMTIDEDILIALTGSGLVAGDDLVITTMPGRKSVLLYRGGQVINVLNALGGDSEWIVLQPGVNTFVFTAIYGDQLLEFQIEYENVHEGI